jgi:hypothetical protein
MAFRLQHHDLFPDFRDLLLERHAQKWYLPDGRQHFGTRF